ncbi:MAG: SRPBCC family protein [Mycobacteriales bacterium]
MKLENRFTVPVPREQALMVLLDVERIAPCMPGATLTSRDGDDFTGTVKVKVGPINLTYGGQATFVSVDEAAGVVVIEGSGKETRGTGTAKALVTCRLIDNGSSTDVEVDTDLAITGKPAQFGRGVLADVSAKLVDQFAACLGKEILIGTPGDVGPGQDAAADRPDAASAPPPPPVRAAEPIDLLGTAGAPVLKRLAPVLAALVVVLLLVRRRRR